MAEQTLEKKPERWDVPFWEELSDPRQRAEMTDAEVERLLAMSPFSRMNPQSFPATVPLSGILRNDTRIRRYRRGDVVVREGDYGSAAFLVLEGSVGVVQTGLDDAELGRGESHRRNVFRSVAKLLFGPRSPEVRDARAYPQFQRDGEDGRQGRSMFLQDVPGVMRISSGKLQKLTTVSITAGQMFGELAALGRIPRTATVIAEEDSQLLEIRWQGLRELRRYDDALRTAIDEQYRKYGLKTILRDSELLSHISDDRRALEIVEQLSQPENSQFETYGSFDWYGSYRQLRESAANPLANEPIVAEEGTAPNGLILIRAGFARLSRRYGNGEITFDYLGKGRLYGLAELVRELRTGKQTPLAASLRAVGYLDIVRISTRAFEELVLPHMPEAKLRKAVERSGGTAEPRLDAALTEFLVENRLINATSAMVIDLDRCTRCDDCVRACADGHDNNPRFIRHGTTHGHYMITNACMHCADPVCMIGCPTGAIHRAPDGEVVINDLTCIGCETCARNCPYQNIRMVNVRDKNNGDAMLLAPETQRPIAKATKCDLCIDHHGGPACVRACPHDAMMRVDFREMDTLPAWLGH